MVTFDDGVEFESQTTLAREASLALLAQKAAEKIDSGSEIFQKFPKLWWCEAYTNLGADVSYHQHHKRLWGPFFFFQPDLSQKAASQFCFANTNASNDS